MTDPLKQEATFEYENADQSIICLDPGLNFTYANLKALDMFKLTHDQVVGHHYSEIYPDDKDSIFLRSYKHSLAEDVISEFDYTSRFTSKEFHVVVMPTPNGITVMLREKSYAAENTGKRASVEGALFDNALLGMVVLRTPDEIKYINQRGLNLLGIPEGAIQKTKFTDLLEGSEKGAAQVPLNNIFLQPSASYNLDLLIRGENDPHWVSGIVSNLFDDPRIHGVLYTFFDSDRLRVQEIASRKLGYSLDKEFKFTDRAAIILRRADGVAIAVNPQFLSEVGFEHDQIIGEQILNLTVMEDENQTIEFMDKVSRNANLVDFPITLRVASGEKVRYILNASPLEYEGVEVFLATIHRVGDDAQPAKNIDALRENFEELAERAIAREQQLSLERSRVDTLTNNSKVLFDVARYLLEYEGEHIGLTQVAEMIANGFNYDRVAIILLDTDREQVTGFFRGGPGKSRFWRTPYDELMVGLTGWVVRNEQVAFSPKGYLDPRESPEVFARRTSNQAGSIVVCPILARKKVVGTITVVNRFDQPDIPENDQYLLESIAGQIATALRNINLLNTLTLEVKTHQQTQRALKESRDELDKKVIARTLELTRSNLSLALISKCNDIIKTAKDEKEMLERITRAVVDIAGFKHCWVASVTEAEAFGFRPCAICDKPVSSVESPDSGDHAFYFEFAPMAECVKDRAPIVIHDLSTDTYYKAWNQDAINYQYRSVCCLPIIIEDALYGAIMISHEQKDMFDATNMNTLNTIIQNITVGVQTMSNRRQTQLLSKRFEVAFHNNPAGTLLAKFSDAKIVDMNQAFLDWTGFTRAELIGEPARKFIGMSTPHATRAIEHFFFTKKPIDDLLVPFTNMTGLNKVILLSGREIDLDGEPHAIIMAIDITEKDKIQKELAEAKNNLLAAQKLAELGSWEYKFEGESSEWTPELYRLFGYSQDAPIPYVTELAKRVHPDDREAWLHSILSISETKQPTEMLIRYFPDPNSGEMRYYESVNSPIVNPDGTVERNRGTIQDVTDETVARLEAEEYRAKLEMAQSLAKLGSWQLDFSTNLFTGSLESYRIFEWEPTRPYTMKEFLGSAFPADLPKLKLLWRKAKNGEYYDVEHRIVCPSGTKWIHISGAGEIDPDSKKQLFIGTMQDITERKLSEIEADERDNQLRQFIEVSSMGKTIIDQNMNLIAWNSRMVELTGIPAEEALGKDAIEVLYELTGFNEETRWPIDEMKDLMTPILTTGVMPQNFKDWTHIIFSRAGTQVVLRQLSFVIPEGDHYLIGSSYQDVTDEMMHEKLTKSRLELIEFAVEHEQAEIVKTALVTLEELVDSSFSYFNEVNASSDDFELAHFSKNTLETCGMAGNMVHFPFAEGKLWHSSVNEKRTTIFNRIEPALDLPNKHNPLTRVMFIPVIRHDQVVAIAGVANKPFDYSEQDQRVAEEFLNFAYEIIERRGQTQESERLRQLMNSSNELIATLNNARKFDYINPVGRVLLGIPDGKKINEVQLIDVLSEISRKVFENQALPALDLDGFWSGELEIERKGGTPLIVLASLSRSTDQGFEGYTLIAADLSELKKTEQELLVSQRRAETLLNAVPDMIFRLDENNIIIDYKGQANAKTILPPSEFLNKDFRDVMPPAIGEHIAWHVDAARKNGRTEKVSYELDLPDGKAYFQTRLQADTSTGEVIAVASDLTELHNSLEELREIKENLEEMVRERTGQLELAVEQAELANEAKSDFLAMMSHEIRTPMNGVLGLTHLLQGTQLTEQQKNYLDHIKVSGETLLNIINDILDFSKIEADKLELAPENFDLDELLSSLNKTIGFQASQKGLELRFNSATDIPRGLYADHNRLKQVLLNITNNAIKFTDEGAISVNVEKLAQTKGALTLKFSVSDTGIGMTEEQLGRIFTPFTQADSSTSRKYGGTGLGLVICQRIVKMMGGNINVFSKPNEGTTFSFILSLELSKATDVQKWASEPEVHDLNVLIAGEDNDNNDYMTSIMNSFSFIATPVYNAEDMMITLDRRVEQNKPIELLMIDANLPNLNMSADIAMLKEQYPDMPIIMMVGNDLNKPSPAELNVDGVIGSPFIASSVLNTVMNIFSDPAKLIVNADDQAAENAKISGHLVLLVEDNPVNQLVAEQILLNMGLRVLIAEDGVEAIDIARSEPIELIFMDIQMPHMDGYEATRNLRDIKDEKFTKMPIIAMTAHALTGEREKALNAGMNDYLTKPIDVDRLRHALEKWLPKAEKEQYRGGAEAGIAPSAPKQGLDPVSAITRLGGSEETYRKVLGLFTKEHISDADTIRKHVSSGDLVAAERVAHTLKGVGGTIGAPSLADCALRVETSIKEGKLDQLNSLLKALEKELTEASIRATEYIRK